MLVDGFHKEALGMKRLIIVGCAIMVIVALAATMAAAQVDMKKDERLKQPIVLDFKDTPVSTALQVLFNGTGMNYVIDSGVTGTVKNMHIEVPFEAALKALLKSVDPPLVYKKEPGGDVYIISVKKPEPPPEFIPEGPLTPIEDIIESEDTVIEKISLNFLDAYDVKNLIEGKDTRASGQGGGMGGGMMGGGGGFGGGFGGGGGGFGGGGGGFGGGGGGFGGGGGGFGGGGGGSSWGGGSSGGGGGFSRGF